MFKTKLTLFILLFLHIFCISINADTYKDNSYNFQITSSNTWKTKTYFDGPDRLFDTISPDENVLVRVRAIHLSDPIPMDVLRKVYEREYLKNSSLYKEESTVINGIKGQSFFYHWKYNGHDINVVSWFAILPKMAYIVSQIIPQVILNERVTEADNVINTFQSSLSNSTPVKEKVASKPSVLPAKSVTTISLIPEKSNFTPGQKIRVKFSGLPAKGQDWLALSATNHKPDEYFDMIMLQGKPQSGNHSFKGLSEGKYEIRVYTNWPDGGYTIAAKTGITVAKMPAVPKPPIAPPVLPKKKLPTAPVPKPVIAKPKPAAPKAENLPPVLSKAVPVRPTDHPLLAKVVIGTGYDGVAFIDQKGQTIVGPGLRFRYPGKFVNGYIIAYKDGKDRLFHRTGTVIPSKHKPISTFSDGLAAVKMYTGYNFITETGTTAFEKGFRNAKTFSEGLAPAKTSKGWGYINTSGTFVIQPQFEDAWPFKGGRAFVTNETGRKAMIDRTGTLLTGFDFVGFSAPKNNLIKVDLPPPAMGSTLISMNGDDILGRPLRSIALRYDNNKTFAGWIVTDTTGAIALLDPSGGQIVPLGQARTIGRIGDGLVVVQTDEKGPHGYMDMQGNWAIEPKYYRANPFSEDRAFVQPQAKGPVHMIDKTGKIIKEFTTPNILIFFGQIVEGLAAVVDMKNEYAMGYVNASGEWAIKPVFNGDAVSGIPNRSGFRFGLAPVCNMEKPKKCGFIDRSGEWVIEPTFIVLPKHFQ